MLWGSLVESAEELMPYKAYRAVPLSGNAGLTGSTNVCLLIILALLHWLLMGVGGKERWHAGQGLVSGCTQAGVWPTAGFPLDPPKSSPPDA